MIVLFSVLHTISWWGLKPVWLGSQLATSIANLKISCATFCSCIEKQLRLRSIDTVPCTQLHKAETHKVAILCAR